MNALFVGTVWIYWQSGTGPGIRPFSGLLYSPAPNLNGGARSLNQQGFGLAAATRVGQKDGYNYLFRRHFILPELAVEADKKLMEVWLVVVRVELCFTVGMAQWHSGTVAHILRSEAQQGILRS